MKTHRVSVPSFSVGGASLLLLASTALALSGCPNDFGIDGCTAETDPPVADFWAGPGVTDVTFLAFGDSQVFLDPSIGADDGGRKNDLHVQALNVADTLRWDALGVDQPVSRIRGVIMAGDITQNCRDAREGANNEYKVFVDSSREIARLHDLKADPFEQSDLIGSQHPEHVAALKKFQAIVDMMPDRDARPIYEPRAPNSWDVEVGGPKGGRKKRPRKKAKAR